MTAGPRMIQQPDFSPYRLRFTCVVPLDRRWVEPDEDAFDGFDVDLRRFDSDAGGDATVATAIAYRIRADSAADLPDAAAAEPDSELLEQVCTEALDEEGEVVPEIAAALSDLVLFDVLVIDRTSTLTRTGRGLLTRTGHLR